MLPGVFVVLALCFAALVAGIRLWPGTEIGFAIACAAASIAAGIVYWRAHRRRDRSVGIAFVGVLAVILCLEYVPSGRWPVTVDEAVDEVYGWLSEGERRDLAYMHDEEMSNLHMGLGMSVRDGLGMWSGNTSLMGNCEDGSWSPDECARVILAAFKRRLRAELPAPERLALLTYERRLARVRVPARNFDEAPLREVVAHLQSAIDAQLPPEGRIRIDVAAGVDGEIRMHAPAGAPLIEWLVELDRELRDVSVEKHPPDLLIAPYYRRVRADLPTSLPLTRLYATGQGMDEDLRELIRDDAAWRAMWTRIEAAGGAQAAQPPVDFSKHMALVVALGELGVDRPRGEIVVTLLGRRHDAVHLQVVEQEVYEECASYHPPPGRLPLAVFLVPARFEGAAFSFHGSSGPCETGQANQP